MILISLMNSDANQSSKWVLWGVLWWGLGVCALAIFIFCTLTSPLRAAEPTDTRLEAGIAAYDAGDFDKAKAYLVPLADTGNPKAMNMVGLMYDFGNGFSKNSKVACDWYESSALKDFPSAQRNLSLCYFVGDGRTIDKAEWIKWATKAAESGDVTAQINLAWHYSNLDNVAARKWAQKAAAQGSAVGKAFLWANGDKHLVQDFWITDLACVAVMISFFERSITYCD